MSIYLSCWCEEGRKITWRRTSNDVHIIHDLMSRRVTTSVTSFYLGEYLELPSIHRTPVDLCMRAEWPVSAGLRLKESLLKRKQNIDNGNWKEGGTLKIKPGRRTEKWDCEIIECNKVEMGYLNEGWNVYWPENWTLDWNRMKLYLFSENEKLSKNGKKYHKFVKFARYRNVRFAANKKQE